MAKEDETIKLLSEAYDLIDRLHPSRPRPMLPASDDMYGAAISTNKLMSWKRRAGALLDLSNTSSPATGK